VTTPTKVDASEAWRLLHEVFLGRTPRFPAIAASLDLTPGEMRALLTLDADHPKPMRALAEEWHCDASNVTWLVDRLEERGFVERQPDPSDRRVRAIAITKRGVQHRHKVEAKLYDPPAEFERLSASEVATLTRILRKVTPA
jgi:DNA-binding MarR family transcriptional regulator